MQLIAKGNGISIVRLAANEVAKVVDSYGNVSYLKENEINYRLSIGGNYQAKLEYEERGPKIVIIKGEIPAEENEFGLISP